VKQVETAGANTIDYVTGTNNQEALERRGTGALQIGTPSAWAPSRWLNQISSAGTKRASLIPDIKAIIGSLEAATETLADRAETFSARSA